MCGNPQARGAVIAPRPSSAKPKSRLAAFAARLLLAGGLLLPQLAAAAEEDSRVRELEYLGYFGGVADAVTTHVGVHNLHVEENNPLLGNHPSDGVIAAAAVVHCGLVYLIAHSGGSDRAKRISLTIFDALKFGVVGSNVSVITHGHVSKPIGVGVGIAIPLAWGLAPHHEKSEEEKAEESMRKVDLSDVFNDRLGSGAPQ